MDQEKKIFSENSNNTTFIALGVIAIIVAIIVSIILMEDEPKKKKVVSKTPVETVAKVTPAPEPVVEYDYNEETTYEAEDTPSAEKPTLEEMSNAAIAEETKEAQVNSTIDYIEYVVQKNDSLFSIAKRRYGSSHYWALIYKKNHIKDPDKIYIGQTLLLPISSQGNSVWDTKELVDTYVDIYKTYRTLEKVEGVYFMLLEAVKRIEPELVPSYLERIRAFDHDFANRTTSEVPMTSTTNSENLQTDTVEPNESL